MRDKQSAATSIARAVIQGGLAGLAGTAAMSVAMLGAQKAGWMGKMPPKKITEAALGALRVNRSAPRSNALSTVAHFGYGVAGGVLFAAGTRRLLPRARGVGPAAGAAFGIGVWALSYLGWVPALGIMPPPHRDRPGRPTAMVLAHLIYGTLVGGLAAPRSRALT
jgi:hypothetical protein